MSVPSSPPPRRRRRRLPREEGRCIIEGRSIKEGQVRCRYGLGLLVGRRMMFLVLVPIRKIKVQTRIIRDRGKENSRWMRTRSMRRWMNLIEDRNDRSLRRWHCYRSFIDIPLNSSLDWVGFSLATTPTPTPPLCHPQATVILTLELHLRNQHHR